MTLLAVQLVLKVMFIPLALIPASPSCGILVFGPWNTNNGLEFTAKGRCRATCSGSQEKKVPERTLGLA
jgi:hypothetical protein